MTIICTYCCANKDDSVELLPAINRYKSQRIDKIKKAAHLLELQFYILSGELGIIHEHEAIPFYDHPLIDSEVDDHSKVVCKQLMENTISTVLFFTNNPDKDLSLKPYLDCMHIACQKADCSLNIIEVDLDE